MRMYLFEEKTGEFQFKKGKKYQGSLEIIFFIFLDFDKDSELCHEIPVILSCYEEIRFDLIKILDDIGN